MFINFHINTTDALLTNCIMGDSLRNVCCQPMVSLTFDLHKNVLVGPRSTPLCRSPDKSSKFCEASLLEAIQLEAINFSSTKLYIVLCNKWFEHKKKTTTNRNENKLQIYFYVIFLFFGYCTHHCMIIWLAIQRVLWPSAWKRNFSQCFDLEFSVCIVRINGPE
jgi:hypothetical protein